jgi:putative hydrolase of the HAD superfamily
MRRQPPRALLIDLDGVLRHVATPPPPEALAWERLRPALAGEISHEEWLAATIAAMPGDPAAAERAVAEWAADRGTVDAVMLGFVGDVRAAGIPVGLATNGTDRLPADLVALGLDGAFDVVVNSSVVGIHKPAPGFFEAACDAIGVAAPWVMVVDEDDRAVRAARALTMLAYRWTGREGLPYLRAALSLA